MKTTDSFELARVSLNIRPEDTARPDVDYIGFDCPALDAESMASIFRDLETALIDIDNTFVPRLLITCRSVDTVRILLTLIFDAVIFTQIFGRLKKVALQVVRDGRMQYIWSEDILSAPTSFALDDDTILLTTAQRVEWLLREQRSERAAYMRNLLESAHKASSAVNAVSPSQSEARTEGIGGRGVVR